ncbi:MAG: hypothetical protein ACRDU8_08695 [Egibacteraceae bacterium]
MIESTTQRRTAVATAVGAVLVLYAVTFLLGALLHSGVRIPLGFAVLDEPRIVPAVIVEGLCTTALAVSAYAVFARKTWAWAAVTAAHTLALAGVLLGMAAIAAGRGPSTVLNDTYHRVMVVLLVAGLALLSTSVAKAALGRSDRAPRPS